MLGLFRADDARLMAVAGSWSGAVIGGLMFGAGMVLARGCSGRLLVLAATGNLRSVIAGMVFALVAQMAMSGWACALAALDGQPLDHGRGGATRICWTWSGLARTLGCGWAWQPRSWPCFWRFRHKLTWTSLVFASGVGFAVALGWITTWTLAQVAFDPINVTSATFTGPSANTLMFFFWNPCQGCGSISGWCRAWCWGRSWPHYSPKS